MAIGDYIEVTYQKIVVVNKVEYLIPTTALVPKSVLMESLGNVLAEDTGIAQKEEFIEILDDGIDGN